MPDLSFILLSEPSPPDAAALIDAAAALGFQLTAEPGDDDAPQVYALARGGTLMVMPIMHPHPDAVGMPGGPLAPDRAHLEAHQGHCIVTALGLEGSDAQKRLQMALLTAATIAACPAIAAMLAHHVHFCTARLFAELTTHGAGQGRLPIELDVQITAAQEDDTRMAFLTHGMQLHGREELLITAPIQGQGALRFLYQMMHWMIGDPDKHLPTGDTVGRDADEQIKVQRVPNPVGEGPPVIRLDLPD